MAKYFVYHYPVGNDTTFRAEKCKLVAEKESAFQAKLAAIRFIGEGRKVCVITSKPVQSVHDVLYFVDYQNGSKFWKDPVVARKRTGWVFNPIHPTGKLELLDSKGKVKKG